VGGVLKLVDIVPSASNDVARLVLLKGSGQSLGAAVFQPWLKLWGDEAMEIDDSQVSVVSEVAYLLGDKAVLFCGMFR
jgi:hypothetical protein